LVNNFLEAITAVLGVGHSVHTLTWNYLFVADSMSACSINYHSKSHMQLSISLEKSFIVD